MPSLLPEDMLPEEFRGHPLMHLEGIEALMRTIQEQGDSEEFLGELRAPLHTLVDAIVVPEPDTEAGFRVVNELFAIINDWLLSYQLAASPQWRKQMEESERERASGELGEAVLASEIAERLKA